MHIQMQDVIERDEEQALMRQYTRPKASHGGPGGPGSAHGFVVSNAPWSSSEDFPSLGGGGSVGGAGGQRTQWGPSSRGPNLPRI